MKQVGNDIKVSICCVAYNHERFIKKCLDGFVMQQTNFLFEILVHDDASTDNTASIVREYEENYPKLFRCVYQIENQFYKQNTLVNILFRMAGGKYIALCEGDDYWTDPHKLQKQVDFLELNDNFSACAHYYDILRGNVLIKNKASSQIDEVSLVDILNMRAGLHTATLLFRSDILKNRKFPKNIMSGDLYFYLCCSIYGKIKFLPYNMSVYRKHIGGLSNTVAVSKMRNDFNMLPYLLEIDPRFPKNSFRLYVIASIINYSTQIKRYQLFKYALLFQYYLYTSKIEYDISDLLVKTKKFVHGTLPRFQRRLLRLIGFYNDFK